MPTATDGRGSARATDGPPPAATLAYSNPDVFFAGAYRYRSLKGFCGALVGALATAGLCTLAVKLMEPWGAAGLQPPARWVWASSVGLLALAMAALTTYAIWAWVVHLEVPVRVTHEGIERGRRVWSWRQISGFGGLDAGGGRVLLSFAAGRGFLATPRHLMTTPALTAAEFTDLVERLTPYLAAHHPHVRVEKKPGSSG